MIENGMWFLVLAGAAALVVVLFAVGIHTGHMVANVNLVKALGG